MQMKQFGELKSHAGVKGSPAIARFLDIRAGETNIESIPAHKFFFGATAPDRSTFAPTIRFTISDLDSLVIQTSTPANPPMPAPKTVDVPAQKSIEGLYWYLMTASKESKEAELHR